MDRVIVAFEADASALKVKDMLERDGIRPYMTAHSGAAVLRAAAVLEGGVAVCGFKLRDMTAEELAEALPRGSEVLVIAPAVKLELCSGDNILKLPAPVRRGDLIDSVRLLMKQELSFYKRTKKGFSEEDKRDIERAKALLAERNRMSEGEAHRFLQKKSMNSGVSMPEAARLVLAGG